MMIRGVGFSLKVVNVEHRAHVSFLIDKVDTMQKSRLQGPSTFHSVFKGPRFISNTLRPRSEPRKAVPSLNVPTCAFFETIWSQGNWSSKRLTWNILYNDKVETVFAINYGTQFSKKNSSIQNGSISIGRSNSRIAFWVSERGPPLWTTVLCPQMEEPQFGRRTREKPKPSISARMPLCKSLGFGLIEGKSPSGNSIHPGDFGRNAIFTVNWGTKGS